jgi:hypothetical protein
MGFFLVTASQRDARSSIYFDGLAAAGIRILRYLNWLILLWEIGYPNFILKEITPGNNEALNIDLFWPFQSSTPCFKGLISGQS